METIKEIQDFVFLADGLKTSVKKGNGSMKGYIIIWPIYQGGIYPDISQKTKEHLRVELSQYDYSTHPLFCSNSEICLYGLMGDIVKYKKKHKPKPIQEMNVKSWGSKNSQMRLDKASESHHKRLIRGENTVGFY